MYSVHDPTVNVIPKHPHRHTQNTVTRCLGTQVMSTLEAAITAFCLQSPFSGPICWLFLAFHPCALLHHPREVAFSAQLLTPLETTAPVLINFFN